MKNMATILAVAVMVTGVSAAWAGQGGCPCLLAKADTKAVAAAAVPAAAVQAAPVDAGNKFCPVTGEPVAADLANTAEYKGKIYHFCCPGCKGPFLKDPEAYIKKIEQQEKAGLTKA